MNKFSGYDQLTYPEFHVICNNLTQKHSGQVIVMIPCQNHRTDN